MYQYVTAHETTRLAMQTFEDEGFVDFGTIIDPELCDELASEIRKTRSFDSNLFLEQSEFEHLKPDAFNKNPRPGCNLLEDLTGFSEQIENSPQLTTFLTALLGPGYDIFRRKLVCGVSTAWLPEWIRQRVEGKPSNNLAHFIRPEHTDITWFYGIDFHQDLVDWKDSEPDFVTVYVYIDDVARGQAPLFILPRSHLAGEDSFPHHLTMTNADAGTWTYKSRIGRECKSNQVILERPKGSVFCWHALTLHGTQPATVLEPRISIRYLIKKGQHNKHTLIQALNERIGASGMSNPRHDLDAKGMPVIDYNQLAAAAAADRTK